MKEKITYKDNIKMRALYNTQICLTTNLLAAKIIDYHNAKKNDYSKEELSIFDLYHLIHNIIDTLHIIEEANVFIKRFYNKKYYEQYEIGLREYVLYHYDIICHKVATLKDLFFKLIIHLYDIKVDPSKESKYEIIKKSKHIINNDCLFSILEEYHSATRVLQSRRNASTHDGHIEHETVDKLYLFESITRFAKQHPDMPTHGISSFLITKGTDSDLYIKKQLKDFKREMLGLQNICINYTHLLFDSLSDVFIKKINNLSDEYHQIINQGQNFYATKNQQIE